jgi:hypothetical protein
MDRLNEWQELVRYIQYKQPEQIIDTSHQCCTNFLETNGFFPFAAALYSALYSSKSRRNLMLPLRKKMEGPTCVSSQNAAEHSHE